MKKEGMTKLRNGVNLQVLIFSFLKRGKLAKRFALLIACIVIIPIVIIDILSISMSVNSVINESKKSYLAATDSTAKYFQLAVKTAQNNATQLMSNELIQRYYSESKQAALEDYEKITLQTDANKAMQNVLISNNMIAGIYILVNKEKSLFNPSIVFEIDYEKIKNTGWYKKILDAGGPTIIEVHDKEFDEVAKKNNTNIPEYAFCIGLPFKDIATNETLGVMLLDVSKNWLRDQLQESQISQQGGFMLAVSSQGQVVLPTEWENKFKNIPNKDTNFIKKVLANMKADKQSGAFDTVYSNQPFLITYSLIPDTPWAVIGMIPISQLMTSARKLEVISIVLTIIFTMIALVLGIYFALRIVSDIEKITNAFEVAEKGDLTIKLDIQRNDEIGLMAHSFNNMTKNIKQLIEKGITLSGEVTSAISTLSTVAGETAAASNEVAKAISEIAEGASNQAKEATGVVEVVSRFGEKIETIVESSNKMEKLTKDVSNLSEKGESVVEVLSNISLDTVNITNAMISTINQLADYSRSIGKIIQVLSSISEQTKLLALNASIEAAKAGEAGRGFAVVASEIRKLADQSKESTREVEDMIKRIVSQTKAAQDVADKVEDVIEKQNEAVKNVSAAFSSIKSAMDELIDGIENINQSIMSIDKEKDTIVRSIENISAISQETAASSEEVSASTQEQLAAIEELRAMAESLNKLAQDLKDAMQVFRV
ncbi:methyl-accepting chemotaxis protein [Caldicellulosiruptor diazotrophicus]|uniref:Methyl-accepting chemotaxis protein n=2 Tax=Caldicellulosiruptor diazotrophicus TaxID=2806205 RepID=A0ABM7NJQ0_9FIRM|nr:methyl-accepting chemotaxis protein [Caldicellulosiruptor diazotrophicus]BCS80323.1 methyl-accepting chemotaxis protein [Caldicellulosiruptor diazotrophicus]